METFPAADDLTTGLVGSKWPRHRQKTATLDGEIILDIEEG